MKFRDDISMPHTHTHTDKPKPICPPLFQSWVGGIKMTLGALIEAGALNRANMVI